MTSCIAGFVLECSKVRRAMRRRTRPSSWSTSPTFGAACSCSRRAAPKATAKTQGLVVLVRESKTDQERRGEEVPVFFANDERCCPVRALDAWLTSGGITEGAIFRALGRDDRLGARLTAETVANRVKHYAKLAGLEWRDYAGHSLRRGFISTAARRGPDLDSIAVTSRHRSLSVLRDYIERETIFEHAAGEGLL